MSFANMIAMVSGKRPVWLYELTRDGVTVYLTSSGSIVSTPLADYFDQVDVFSGTNFFGLDWTPTTITHTRFMRTGAIGREETQIVFPQSDTWAQTYLGDLSTSSNSIIVRHGFANDPDAEFVVKFRGRVIYAKPILTRITLHCENRFTEARAKALVKVMQKNCPHVLYFKPESGGGCGANLASFQTSATASALNGKALTVADAAAQASGYYTGGVIEYAGRRDMIANHSGTTITMLNGLPGLATAIAGGSATVKIAPGCNRGRSQCNDRFGQLHNFGGFPWMANTPYDGRNIF